MAITDIDISEEFTAGAPSIKYTGDMDPNKQMASDPSWGAEWEDIYQDYKIKQIELGQEFISKEEFIDMHRDHGEASPVIGGEETMQVASHEGNDAWMENRMEQLMDEGMDWASAAKQAQEEARSGNVPEPMATGGRAHFGLGSIFKSVGKAAKKLVKSPVGKAALLGLGAYYMPGIGAKASGGWGNMFKGLGSNLFGKAGVMSKTPWGVKSMGPGTSGLLSRWGLTKGAGSMMPTALGWGAGAVAAGMGAQAFENMSGDEINALKNDPAALRSYLKQYHTNTHPDKSPEEVDIWVEQNMYSTGGRVNFEHGGMDWFPWPSHKGHNELEEERYRNMSDKELRAILKKEKTHDNRKEETWLDFDLADLVLDERKAKKIGGEYYPFLGLNYRKKDKGLSMLDEVQQYKYGTDQYDREEGAFEKLSMRDAITDMENKWDVAIEDGYEPGKGGEFDNLGIYEKEDIGRRIELGWDEAKGPGTNTGIMRAAEGGRVNFGGGGRGWQAQLKAEDIAQEDYGQEFYSLSNAQQHKVYNKALVEIDDMLSEAADMMRKNEAQGGRIGYDNGGPGEIGGDNVSDVLERVKELQDEGLDLGAAMAQAMKELSQGKAQGGRIGYAYGPDQTAEAAGIMGQLPVRNNGAGVKELDLRDSGGFIPPVGVKEKADDIPAMLSNNEFVFTADAVKAAGGGSVEKGAQVMYDQMKKLENKVA